MTFACHWRLKFLETVMADATRAQGLIAKHPITTKGLENEQKKD